QALRRALAERALAVRRDVAHVAGCGCMPTARQPPGDTGHLIADALQHLLDYGTADLSDDTKDMYRLHMGHLVRVLADRDVGKFTIDDSQEYIKARLKEGAHRETVRKELVTLRRGLTLAHERKILAADPRGLIPKFRVRYVP